MLSLLVGVEVWQRTFLATLLLLRPQPSH